MKIFLADERLEVGEDEFVIVKTWRHELAFPDVVVTDNPVLGVKFRLAAKRPSVHVLEVDTGLEREVFKAAISVIPIQELRLLIALTLPTPKPRRSWKFWRRRA